MTAAVLITGGAGLVAANVARRILAAEPDARVTVLDVGGRTPPLAEFLAGFGDRLRVQAGDVADPRSLAAVPDAEALTHVVHAAAVAHVPSWEREQPSRYVEVNVRGTLNVLEWAVRLPCLRRLLHVSTGGVYGSPTAASPEGPQGEEGPLNPAELYGVTKLAAEGLVARYGELFGLDACVIRLSTVFGPMERPTAGRRLMSLPYRIARAATLGEPLRLSERTLLAGGDFLSAVDVAGAAHALLTIGPLEHRTFNVAHGAFTTVPELLALATAVEPGLRHSTVAAPADADVDMDPALRRARWNAYAIERIRRQTGWAPRPLAAQVAGYLEWVREDPPGRCPEDGLATGAPG